MEDVMLSVVIPCFNNAQGVERTIKSIISQTYKSIEIIVVDGGSKDNSLEIFDKYKEYISATSEPDNGIYDAVNKGIKRAKGNFVCFMPGGDIFANNKAVEIMLDGHTQYDLIIANVYKVYPNGTKKLFTGVNSANPDVVDYLYSCTYPQAAFLRRDLFDKYGFFSTEYLIPSDLFLFYEWTVEHKVSMIHLDYCAACFYADGLSSKRTDIAESEKRDYFTKRFGEESYQLFKELSEYRNSRISRWGLTLKNKFKRIPFFSRLYFLTKHKMG